MIQLSFYFSFPLYLHSTKQTVYAKFSKAVKIALDWLHWTWQKIRAYTSKLFDRKLSVQRSGIIQLNITNTSDESILTKKINTQSLIKKPEEALQSNIQAIVKISRATNLPKSILRDKIFEYGNRDLFLTRICKTWTLAYTTNRTLFNDYNNCSDYFLRSIIKRAKQHLNKSNSEKDYQLFLSTIQKTVFNLAKEWPEYENILAWEGHPADFKRMLKISEWIQEQGAIDFANALSKANEQARHLPAVLKTHPQSKLKALEEWIKTNQHNILQLDLNNNLLKILPSCISQLVSLQYLNLNHNMLKFLPKTITKLQALNFLNLNNNKLQFLPKKIGFLHDLQFLFLGNNQLKAVPKSIGKLQELKILYLNNNKLQSLPKSIGQCYNLQTLHLRYNQLTYLPKGIGSLTAVTELDLAYNQIELLPEEIGRLNNLEEFRLAHNQLTAIPESTEQLNSLVLLDLTGNNKILSLPNGIMRKATFRYLNLLT